MTVRASDRLSHHPCAEAPASQQLFLDHRDERPRVELELRRAKRHPSSARPTGNRQGGPCGSTTWEGDSRRAVGGVLMAE